MDGSEAENGVLFDIIKKINERGKGVGISSYRREHADRDYLGILDKLLNKHF